MTVYGRVYDKFWLISFRSVLAFQDCLLTIIHVSNAYSNVFSLYNIIWLSLSIKTCPEGQTIYTLVEAFILNLSICSVSLQVTIKSENLKNNTSSLHLFLRHPDSHSVYTIHPLQDADLD